VDPVHLAGHLESRQQGKALVAGLQMHPCWFILFILCIPVDFWARPASIRCMGPIGERIRLLHAKQRS
jgi:hypothetical protein